MKLTNLTVAVFCNSRPVSDSRTARAASVHSLLNWLRAFLQIPGSTAWRVHENHNTLVQASTCLYIPHTCVGCLPLLTCQCKTQTRFVPNFLIDTKRPAAPFMTKQTHRNTPLQNRQPSDSQYLIWNTSAESINVHDRRTVCWHLTIFLTVPTKAGVGLTSQRLKNKQHSALFQYTQIILSITLRYQASKGTEDCHWHQPLSTSSCSQLIPEGSREFSRLRSNAGKENMHVRTKRKRRKVMDRKSSLLLLPGQNSGETE